MNSPQQIPQELKQFVADLTRNCQKYPFEFAEKDLQPVRKPSASARRDPLSPMQYALQQVNLK